MRTSWGPWPPHWQALAVPDLPGVMSLQNLSGWMGKTGPSFSSPDEVRSPSPRGGWGQGARSGVRVCVPWEGGEEEPVVFWLRRKDGGSLGVPLDRWLLSFMT